MSSLPVNANATQIKVGSAKATVQQMQKQFEQKRLNKIRTANRHLFLK